VLVSEPSLNTPSTDTEQTERRISRKGYKEAETTGEKWASETPGRKEHEKKAEEKRRKKRRTSFKMMTRTRTEKLGQLTRPK
jgi:hypothetical protein